MAGKQPRRAFSGQGGGQDGNKTFLGEPLEVTPMPFNAVMLDTDNMRVTDTSDFTTRLLVTVQQLRREGRSSMWVRVHALNGHLLGVLGTFGFKCHHCEPESVIMNLWLQPGKENKVPPYATHLVGVAGFCQNKKGEVLLVKEGSKNLSGWKLPGGYINPGEEFGAAAVREVEEETGVRSSFEGLLALRHQHQQSFGVDDIYVVTRLQALTDELRLCSSEIQDARWVPLKQFQDEASHPILRTVAELTRGWGQGEGPVRGDIVEREHPSILPGRPPYKLYHAPLPGQ
ncbi:hypothetical protein NSK_003261 [Nannochloropsis salina CCMP1776]|uniref:Nudix hydrolase domain-containing protein n=1 Tax=Nannochloropsis salina CCMP1776 TaxID=1027361 RepID=A0A4D9D5W2_9STRA|nr:hypothetical protein NSK_003261 [Nannochloropsis salina CCMP1776]|eukprot:TFJ85757.1 hypothetical protein NSK_003261 [Nannochloropsis salina CCMP1776]